MSGSLPMRVLGYVIAAIFLLACVAAVGTISIYSVRIFSAVVSGARSLEPSVYVPLSVTLLTAVMGLAATLFAQARARRAEIASAHRERKVEIYLEFLVFLERLFMSSKPELGVEKIDERAMTLELMKFRTKAVLWGSPGVLQAVSDMSKVEQTDTKAMFSVIDNIQREMRKDIGLSNWGLGNYFFAKLPLSDADEFDRLISSR